MPSSRAPRLTEANAAYRTQTIELLIAALAHAIGKHRCRIELEGHGREALFDDIDASRTLGWLTSHYPVSVPVRKHAGRPRSPPSKDTLRAVPNKGLGFGVLRHYGDDATRAALAARAAPARDVQLSRPVRRTDRATPRSCRVSAARAVSAIRRVRSATRSRFTPIWTATRRRTLKLHWVYGSTQFERATIEALAQRFESALAEIVTRMRGAHRDQAARARRPAIIPLARDGGLTQAALERLPLDLRGVDDIYPLSPMQQGILFHSLFAPEQSTYVNQLVATLIAPDVERLRAAFEAAVPRHDILRTGFTPDEAAPMQIVHRQARMPFDMLDWRDRERMRLHRSKRGSRPTAHAASISRCRL